MEITLLTFLIVCPMVFLAGFIDSIAGGGGLISLPAYIFAGLPAHFAVATNKMSSSLGTAVSTIRFAKEKLINWKIAVPAILVALLGSNIGARISLLLSESIIRMMLVVVLPLVALIVLNKKLFHDNPENNDITKEMMIKILVAVFIIGLYDGFYGPGTGTFLIIAFTLFGKMSMAQANGNCKIINLTSNLSALAVYILSGKVLWTLGIAAALCNMLGNYLGSGLVMKKGSTIVKPIIIVVIVIFMIKLISEMI